ncbi:trypsin-like peptidase domain-containing protein [Hymenobacter nivis]|uniref:Deoxyribonuclease HsdR n=1 Tax=Hymenobacter nivis TaxID=1850093 RepID=A0A2Z3GU96_9BACT|nr:trypsin-like peptidase domain-containing protein [Hymenobacter nivis]AWM32260.1 deoxyribonuclease HsdR [Hymenobacter nivis]
MRKSTILLLSSGFCLLQLGGVSCNSKKSPDGANTTGRTGTAFSANDTSADDTPSSTAPSSIGNFVKAAKAATPAVVHIKTTYGAPADGDDSFGPPYGSPSGGRIAMGSGSGVLISSDGYIATNNHVVENASKIEVVLPDNRQFSAELIGRDPNTDLALIKIKADHLPSIQLGNSDSVQVGEWAVAVGYPFSLNTTVTAGIISAKARSIGIINRPSRNGNAEPTGNLGVESFIQTDAAINPGNSGGALVDTNGKLIGINSAIASQTGSYAGYSFAIPVNLAKKILGDLREYGSVKRGLLGVSFPSPNAEAQYLQQQGLQPGIVKGVRITGVLSNSAAAAAGLQEGDIIQSIDGMPLNSSAEFSERIARHRPNDVVKLAYLRDNQVRSTSATLKGEEATATAKSNADLDKIYNKLGASFSPLPSSLKQQLNLQAGVLVTEVRPGGFFDHIGIPSGTIIAFINGKSIHNPQDIDRALLSAQSGMIQMLAIAPDGSRVVFDFSLGA